MHNFNSLEWELLESSKFRVGHCHYGLFKSTPIAVKALMMLKMTFIFYFCRFNPITCYIINPEVLFLASTFRSFNFKREIAINGTFNYTLSKYMKFHKKSGKENNLSISLHNPSEIPCTYLIMGYHITQSVPVTLTKKQILLHLHWAAFADDKLKTTFSQSY